MFHCKKKKKFPGDLITFTEETLNGKLHFYCSLCPLYLLKRSDFLEFLSFLLNIYLLVVSNRSKGVICETLSKIKIKSLKRRH